MANFPLRIPEALKNKIKTKAKKEMISMNTLIIQILNKHFLNNKKS